jgi:hypothetical protein
MPIKAFRDIHWPSRTAVHKRGFSTVLNSGNTNLPNVLLYKKTTAKATTTISMQAIKHTFYKAILGT